MVVIKYDHIIMRPALKIGLTYGGPPWGPGVPHALNPPWVTVGPLDPPGALRHILLIYDLLIEGLARQWVACSEGHSPESRRTCRVDT
jgi:hypothetical protein